ncbi:hypothetical protein R4J00_14300 [Brachyspira intermedia]|uniref:hypothetical protein n=1 Tax=Brachyspira intermedia TaxID=84377 RepID=UPI00300683C4
MNFTEQEQDYYELILDILDDGAIVYSERILLNKKKDKYGISDERAKEIEDFALQEIQNKNKPKFNTEGEEEYYELLVDMLEDGAIDESGRSLLNKRKSKYGLSDERVKEIEDFALQEIQNKNKPKFNTEGEKEYYELLEDMLEDGIIDDSERTLLNKRKDKYGISDERAKEFEDYIKSLKGISGNNNFESELHQIESANNSEKVVYNDIKKEDSNTSDKIDTDFKKLENLNVNESSKEISNAEFKDIKKEENNDSKKVIENKEEDIEEFDAEVLAYKKRKKRRGNVSIFDKADYYAKIKRPIWLKLWTWAVILGLLIYFTYNMQYAICKGSRFWVRLAIY